MTFWGELLNKYKLNALSDVLINLEFLADAEAGISEFYRLCAGAMAKHADLWNSLADEEAVHSQIVRKMNSLITKEPKLYSPGMSFSTVNIRLFAVEMQGLQERLSSGKLSPDKIFATALEIEDSIVELCYGKMVETKDKNYSLLAHRLDSDSAEHKKAISSRMNG